MHKGLDGQAKEHISQQMIAFVCVSQIADVPLDDQGN